MLNQWVCIPTLGASEVFIGIRANLQAGAVDRGLARRFHGSRSFLAGVVACWTFSRAEVSRGEAQMLQDQGCPFIVSRSAVRWDSVRRKLNRLIGRDIAELSR